MLDLTPTLERQGIDSIFEISDGGNPINRRLTIGKSIVADRRYTLAYTEPVTP
jgi:hypothetical protein